MHVRKVRSNKTKLAMARAAHRARAAAINLLNHDHFVDLGGRPRGLDAAACAEGWDVGKVRGAIGTSPGVVEVEDEAQPKCVVQLAVQAGGLQEDRARPPPQAKASARKLGDELLHGCLQRTSGPAMAAASGIHPWHSTSTCGDKPRRVCLLGKCGYRLTVAQVRDPCP